MFFGWFHTVIGENQQGIYNSQVDRSFRMGMMWFIFSEVMFFAAFFGALFYARVLVGAVARRRWASRSSPTILLWPHYRRDVADQRSGRTSVASADGTFETVPAFGLPAINTLILLTSGVTVTIAHHALRAGKRGALKVFLALTFILGFTFVGLQAHEYGEAYHELGLRLSTGHLRLDLLHADRLPRSARDDRRHHADGGLAAGAARAFHARPALRLRGGVLVLALRRRGVAGPVHLRVLAVAEPAPILRPGPGLLPQVRCLTARAV